MGIIGVLAAVAIPAYNNYKINAAQAAINSSLQSIGKAFAACLTLNQWGDCNSLPGMQVNCPDCKGLTEDTAVPTLCMQVEQTVGGATYTGCVQSSGGVPRITGNWPIACNKISETHECSSTPNTWQIRTGTTCPTGCTSPTLTTGTCTAGTTLPANVSCTGTGTAPTGTGACATGICS